MFQFSCLFGTKVVCTRASSVALVATRFEVIKLDTKKLSVKRVPRMLTNAERHLQFFVNAIQTRQRNFGISNEFWIYWCWSLKCAWKKIFSGQWCNLYCTWMIVQVEQFLFPRGVRNARTSMEKCILFKKERCRKVMWNIC